MTCATLFDRSRSRIELCGVEAGSDAAACLSKFCCNRSVTDGASRDCEDYKDQEGTGNEGRVTTSTRSPKAAPKTLKASTKSTKPAAAPALKVSKDELRAHVEKLEKTVAALRIKNRELTRAAKVGTVAGAAKPRKAAAKARKTGRSSVVADMPAENDA